MYPISAAKRQGSWFGFVSGRAIAVITASRHHAVRSSKRRAGDGKYPHPRVHQFTIGQDARQNRERGYSHRRSQKKHERQSGRPVAKSWIEAPCETSAKQERRQDTRLACCYHRFRRPPKRSRLHLQTYQEHEQDEPKLAERIQHPETVRGEQAVHHCRRDSPQERGSQKDARGHLANHLGLADEPECHRHQPDGRQDHRHLEKQQFEFRHRSSLFRCSSAARYFNKRCATIMLPDRRPSRRNPLHGNRRSKNEAWSLRSRISMSRLLAGGRRDHPWAPIWPRPASVA